jgi:hypothetical protein
MTTVAIVRRPPSRLPEELDWARLRPRSPSPAGEPASKLSSKLTLATSLFDPLFDRGSPLDLRRALAVPAGGAGALSLAGASPSTLGYADGNEADLARIDLVDAHSIS